MSTVVTFGNYISKRNDLTNDANKDVTSIFANIVSALLRGNICVSKKLTLSPLLILFCPHLALTTTFCGQGKMLQAPMQ